MSHFRENEGWGSPARQSGENVRNAQIFSEKNIQHPFETLWEKSQIYQRF